MLAGYSVFYEVLREFQSFQFIYEQYEKIYCCSVQEKRSMYSLYFFFVLNLKELCVMKFLVS